MNFQRLYHDPKFAGSFSGQNRFIEALKNAGLSTRGARKAFKKIDSYTLHKPVREPPVFRRVYTKGIGYLFNIDLVDMSAWSKQNQGFKWLITCIDTFSKRAHVFKTKTKSAHDITTALKAYLEQYRPKKIEFDSGTEFYNREFLALLRANNIKHYSIYSQRKGSIIERFNRTLKTRMYRAFSARGNRKWIDIVDDLVNGYNTSRHRSIGMSPNEVTLENEAEVWSTLFPTRVHRVQKNKFKVGQSVRITRDKGVFEKGYEMTYTYEVFEIGVVQQTYPITYSIRDFNGETIKGSFYENEIQLVDKSDDIWAVERIIRKRNRAGITQYLVKWQGYPEEANSWVTHGDIFPL